MLLKVLIMHYIARVFIPQKDVHIFFLIRTKNLSFFHGIHRNEPTETSSLLRGKKKKKSFTNKNLKCKAHIYIHPLQSYLCVI